MRVDALIIRDMGLLELDLPPIELHASTSSDIRTPKRPGMIGLSRNSCSRANHAAADTAAVPRLTPRAALNEFFSSTARCVPQRPACCHEAHTGRSANRGNCSQACRLPSTRCSHAKGAGRARQACAKDNNQSANSAHSSTRGRSQDRWLGDMGWKNTPNYRRLLDEVFAPDLARA